MVDFPKSLFNADEMLTISNGFLGAVSGITQDATVTKLTTIITADVAALEGTRGKGLASKLRSRLEEVEAICDNAYTTFRTLTKTLAEQDDETEVADAATVPLTILRNVNWDLHTLGYKKQLVQLAVLLGKLEAPEVVQAMEIAGLTRWYNKLVAATANLKELAGKRLDEIDENGDLPMTKEAREKLYKHLLKLYNHVDTQEELEPSVFGPVAVSFNTVLSTVIPEARARKARQVKNSNEQPVAETATA